MLTLDLDPLVLKSSVEINTPSDWCRFSLFTLERRRAFINGSHIPGSVSICLSTTLANRSAFTFYPGASFNEPIILTSLSSFWVFFLALDCLLPGQLFQIIYSLPLVLTRPGYLNIPLHSTLGMLLDIWPFRINASSLMQVELVVEYLSVGSP